MKPYIYSKSKESSVACNCDLVIGKLFDRYSFTIMLVSLVDYPMIVKKVCSDFFISSSDIYLKDKSNKNYEHRIYTYNNNFTFKSDACGDYRHSIIMDKKEMEYCESRKNAKFQHYAARFAAKEAIFKAISNLLEN